MDERNSDEDATARAERARRGSPFLNTEQAAAYLKLTPDHVKRMRRDDKGPVFRIHGRYIQYHIADLEAWSLARSKQRRGA